MEALPQLIDMLPDIIVKTCETLIDHLPEIIEARSKDTRSFNRTVL